MNIKLSELEKIIDLLKKNILQKLPEEIDIDNDYYWEIPEELLFSPECDVSELVMGQVSEDWEQLERLISEKEDIVSYDLKRLAVLLNYLRFKSRGTW